MAQWFAQSGHLDLTWTVAEVAKVLIVVDGENVFDDSRRRMPAKQLLLLWVLSGSIAVQQHLET
jgi:hypothetical protein